MGRAPGPGHRRGQKPGSGQGQKPGSRPGQKPGSGQGSGQRLGQRWGQKPGSGPGQISGQAALQHSRKQKLDNMKPKHPDEQEIPFRLRELMRSREAMKRPGPGKQKAAEKKQPKPKGPGAQGDVPVPRFRRGKGESERSFVCRMEQEVQRVLFLTENQPQQQPEQELVAPKSKRKKAFQNKKLEKARRKKEEKKEAMLEKSLFQDTVAFGDVVTQPPTITSRPRGRGPAEQAGRKRLLLTPRLGRSLAAPEAPVSMARQRIVAEERARVIQAYRDIQRRKLQQREAAEARTEARRRLQR
ncbi:coiled-coil domain-containing protein 137 [Melopsittacus undulatus]|uniref:coiled-coil domain-containing protein 137 n=1 Tax=Melopsittacus undulatus TaxID=13146 RepID=UPI00146C61C0|nr:coiled-coil domain-containing protein 137 [Melopsittacus undulatus]